MREGEVVFCGWRESGEDDGVYGEEESSSELVGSFFQKRFYKVKLG